MKPKKTIVVDVDVKDMYKNIIDTHSDLFKEDFECFKESHKQYCDALLTLGTFDVGGIRKLFKDGMTCFMVGDKMQDIDRIPIYPLELRVWNNAQLLLILTDSEVNY